MDFDSEAGQPVVFRLGRLQGLVGKLGAGVDCVVHELVMRVLVRVQLLHWICEFLCGVQSCYMGKCGF